MKVRHLFATSPSVRMPNGAQVSPADLPSATNIEYFVSGILTVLTSNVNCSDAQKCSKNCTRSILVQLGAPQNCNLVSACPSEVYDLVKDFEHLLAVFVYDHGGFAPIKTLTLHFNPCPKNLTILDVIIQL